MTGPVHNSAVYVLGHDPDGPVIPPLSPPSPFTRSNGADLCMPIEDLCLTEPLVTTASVPASPCTPERSASPKTSDWNHDSPWPPVPSPPDAMDTLDDRLANAVHVIGTEAMSLAFLTHFYSTDEAARAAFNSAVSLIVSRQRGRSRGKLVVLGVGKSGYIARKLVATFNSLSVHASYLHPTEALHGDMGHIGVNDTLLLITFSGKTPELSLLMPHLDARLPLIVLTGRTPDAPVVLERERQATHLSQTILLPAPVHESETASFGVSAPTTSTTMALAVGDALALTCARELTDGRFAATFGRNHPGGAIGAAYKRNNHHKSSESNNNNNNNNNNNVEDDDDDDDDNNNNNSKKKNNDNNNNNNHSNSKKETIPAVVAARTVKDIMIPLDDIPCVSGTQLLVGGDVLRAAYACKTGWLRLDHEAAVISPSRVRRLSGADLAVGLVALRPWLLVPPARFIPLGAATPLTAANDWLRANMGKPRDPGDDEDTRASDSIIAVLDDGEIVGVLEASGLLDVAF